MLPGNEGLARLTRFEKVQIVGLLRLQWVRERHEGLSFGQAEAILENGDCDLLLQRTYPDGSTKIFDIGVGCRLSQHSENKQ
jgi:hypothetical protein